MTDPSADGLVNLIGELELRLTGRSQSAGFEGATSDLIPRASTYLLVLFDGLGDLQLEHPAAAALAASRRSGLRAPFPTTTTVSLATVSSGMSVKRHGWIAHLMWIPELNRVVNTLKWVDLGGATVSHDTSGMIASPNLWERLSEASIETSVVQPLEFAESPLTRALYRGARYAPYTTEDEFITVALAEAATPGRLVFAYWPPIDFAAHVFGLSSPEYASALERAGMMWNALKRGLPEDTTLIGTADHGMVQVEESAKQLIRADGYRMLDFWGDPRAVMVRGSRRLIDRLHRETQSTLLEGDTLIDMLGAGPPHPGLASRLPGVTLLSPPGGVILPPGFDKRLRGYHGGSTEEETAIPLLVEG